jgi:hypothetical protein
MKYGVLGGRRLHPQPPTCNPFEALHKSSRNAFYLITMLPKLIINPGIECRPPQVRSQSRRSAASKSGPGRRPQGTANITLHHDQQDTSSHQALLTAACLVGRQANAEAACAAALVVKVTSLATWLAGCMRAHGGATDRCRGRGCCQEAEGPLPTVEPNQFAPRLVINLRQLQHTSLPSGPLRHPAASTVGHSAHEYMCACSGRRCSGTLTLTHHCISCGPEDPDKQGRCSSPTSRCMAI